MGVLLYVTKYDELDFVCITMVTILCLQIIGCNLYLYHYVLAQFVFKFQNLTKMISIYLSYVLLLSAIVGDEVEVTNAYS